MANSERDGRTHAERAAAGATAGDMAPGRYSVAIPNERRSESLAAISTEEHALALLTWAAAYDGIVRGRFEAEAWLEALRGYDLHAAKAAITKHFSKSRSRIGRIYPGDVIEIIEEG